MKKKISILLVLLYLTVLFIPLNPVIHYVLHKKYYAEVLCKNKDKPMMHCNGKCHLRKELRQSEDTSSNPNKPVPVPKTNKDKFSVLLDISSIANKLLFFNKENNIEFILPFIQDLFFDVITPPPKLSI